MAVFYYLEGVENQLAEFAALSEPNSISPQALADLLSSTFKAVDNGIKYIYLEAEDLHVNSRVGARLVEHLDSIYDHLDTLDDVVSRLKEAGLLPDQVTVDVPLSSGGYNESSKYAYWYAANGKLYIEQTKANSTTNVSSSYIAAPRVYKEHIMLFEAMAGYKIQTVEIHYSGQYKGDSLTAGVMLDSTTSNVVDDTAQVARTWGTANDGVHIISAVSADGLQRIYLQNVCTTNVQLRITQITITYSYDN